MRTIRWVRWGSLSLLAMLAAACGQYAGVHGDDSTAIAPVVVDQGVAGVDLQSREAQAKGLDQEGAGGPEGAQVVGTVGSAEALGELLENLPELPSTDQGTSAGETSAGGSESTGSDEDQSEGKSTTGSDEKPGAKGGAKDGQEPSTDDGTKGSKKEAQDGTTVGETGGTSGNDPAAAGGGSEAASEDETSSAGSSDEGATDQTTDETSASTDTSTQQDPTPEQLAANASYIDQVTAGYVAHNVTVLPVGFPFVICPVQGHYGYSPGFGDLRCVSDEAWCGGFHYHQGVDIFADLGTPIVAPFDGYIEDATNYVGGISVRVRGAQGYTYNAHLVAIRKEVVGKFVPAGTVVGWVGNTGNAIGTSYHDHFEWHPNYGDAVDPFPYLTVVCPPTP